MLPLLLLLLVTAHGLDAIPTLGKPRPVNSTLGGWTTASTFVLEQPRCVFTDLQDDTVIWLVVALPEAVANFSNQVKPGGPGREFQKFPKSTLAYMTLNTTILNYPCNKNSRDITVLRVGSETKCAKDDTGSSDPYCIVKIDDEAIIRTATVWKTLSPFWGEEYEVHLHPTFHSISIYVMDEDALRYGCVGCGAMGAWHGDLGP
ncbi:uroplakin-3b-like protein [Limosa lapponica baueri]|uniref:Uroplakin-3b-like protein n=1 Tax=Limosa lapponica baueri TaxID=1758121 RepID=A0A2I0T6G1_LIMLA|nr:uroplakin-3b-like protein [Limosa lapponica baueri]